MRWCDSLNSTEDVDVDCSCQESKEENDIGHCLQPLWYVLSYCHVIIPIAKPTKNIAPTTNATPSATSVSVSISMYLLMFIYFDQRTTSMAPTKIPSVPRIKLPRSKPKTSMKRFAHPMLRHNHPANLPKAAATL